MFAACNEVVDKVINVPDPGATLPIDTAWSPPVTITVCVAAAGVIFPIMPW